MFFFISAILLAQENKITPEYIDTQIKQIKQNGETDPDKYIKICQKTYTESEKIQYKKGMLEANRILMTLYFSMQKFEDVIKLSSNTEKLSKELHHYEILSDTYRLKGSSYIEMGFNSAGYEEHKKALQYAEKINTGNTKYYKTSLVYLNMAVYFEKVSKLDSALAYHIRSLKSVEKMTEEKQNLKYMKNQTIAFLNMNIGITYNKLNKTDLAEKHFLYALKMFEDNSTPHSKSNEIIFFSEIAYFYLDQKEYKKAISFAQKGKILEAGTYSLSIRINLYETLFESYSKMGQSDSANHYMDQYNKLQAEFQKTESKRKDITIKQIVSDNDKKNKKDMNNILMIIGGIVLCSFLLILFYWRRHNKILHDKYQIAIEKLQKEPTDNAGKSSFQTEEYANEPQKSNFIITDETVTSLLNKLSKFEDSQKFTKSDMSLPLLASQLNINTKYLSNIINEYKGKNFNNYINGLRINYIMKLLYEKPEYREYKTSYLAECCGFSSRVVFTTVFKKETGFTPSYFINSLKNEEKQS